MQDIGHCECYVTVCLFSGLYPSVVNLASRAVITANATCGQNGAVKYCKLVEHVDQMRKGHQCSVSCFFDVRNVIKLFLAGV